jgi:hypothetical protein
MKIINKRGGDQLQKVHGKSEGFPWSRQMELHVCLGLMHVLLKHILLHEQRPMCGVIMLIEMG